MRNRPVWWSWSLQVQHKHLFERLGEWASALRWEVDFDCSLRFLSEHFHDLMGKSSQFPAFQKLIASKHSNYIGSANFSASLSHFCYLKNISNWSALSPITRAPNFIGINCDVGIRNLVPYLEHVNLVWVNECICISRINNAHQRDIEKKTIAKMICKFLEIGSKWISIARE